MRRGGCALPSRYYYGLGRVGAILPKSDQQTRPSTAVLPPRPGRIGAILPKSDQETDLPPRYYYRGRVGSGGFCLSRIKKPTFHRGTTTAAGSDRGDCAVSRIKKPTFHRGTTTAAGSDRGDCAVSRINKPTFHRGTTTAAGSDPGDFAVSRINKPDLPPRYYYRGRVGSCRRRHKSDWSSQHLM